MTGLSPATEYTYTVTANDNSAAQKVKYILKRNAFGHLVFLRLFISSCLTASYDSKKAKVKVMPCRFSLKKIVLFLTAIQKTVRIEQ